MQCCILDQFISDQTNLQHVLAYDYSSMILLLPQFKYVADLYNDTTYGFGDKQSVGYLEKNGINCAQASMKMNFYLLIY